MSGQKPIQPKIRIHLTNVNGVGAGAAHLLQSLLPALVHCGRCVISKAYLPSRGPLADFFSSNKIIAVDVYKRILPNALSRLLECTVFGARFDGLEPLLVFGDIPLRCKAPQTVFVQTAHLLPSSQKRLTMGSIKYIFVRLIFRLNSRYAKALIVQTKLMKEALIEAYPQVIGRVHVLGQPVPAWLLGQKLRRTQRVGKSGDGLNLIYPAAEYPHKNHKLFSELTREKSIGWPVKKLILTVSRNLNPAPAVPWIECHGFLRPQQMIESYKYVDALLFLSKDESYGFPLVEAMFIGLPIICPDLPYARILCHDEAIYFDPNSISSLEVAIHVLKLRLDAGWWPNWTNQLMDIPESWDKVADTMTRIALTAEKTMT